LYVIAKTDPDVLMFDLLSEDDGTPILFMSLSAAETYIETICESFGVPLESYMMSDGIEICRMH